MTRSGSWSRQWSESEEQFREGQRAGFTRGASRDPLPPRRHSCARCATQLCDSCLITMVTRRVPRDLDDNAFLDASSTAYLCKPTCIASSLATQYVTRPETQRVTRPQRVTQNSDTARDASRVARPAAGRRRNCGGSCCSGRETLSDRSAGKQLISASLSQPLLRTGGGRPRPGADP